MRRFILPTAIASLMIAGCASEERPPAPTPRPIPVRPRPPAAAAATPADYVARASSTDLFEIRSSELALTRATNPRIRDFARKMMRDHSGTSGQLSLAGRRLNLLPSATLRPEHEAMMRDLLASSDFDRLYVQQQLRVHKAALSLHSAFAARGSSPTLRPVAAAAVPIVRRHLQELRGMQ
jgi:putative membrane protein